jgi:hypothetical protein
MSFERKLLGSVLLCAMSSQALAALPPLSPEELEQGATLIISGSVSNIDVTTSGLGRSVDWVIKLQAKVDAVSKGDVQAGDTISIQCWRLKSRPAGWAGPSGHHSIPAEGSQFEMWLRQGDEGEWIPLQPNGIRLLDRSKAFDFDAVPDSASNRAGLVLLSLLLLCVVAGVAVVAIVVRRKPQPTGLKRSDPLSAMSEPDGE